MTTLRTWVRAARREIWNGFVVALWAAWVVGILSWLTVLPSLGLLWVLGVLR